ARADGLVVFLIQPIEEVVYPHAQNLSDLEQPTGRHAVDAAFVFVGLLIGHPDKISELLLRQAEHDAALADARSDISVDVLGPARRSARGAGLGAALLTLPALTVSDLTLICHLN